MLRLRIFAILAVLSITQEVSLGDDPPKRASTRVAVRCSQPQLVNGLPLGVLVSDALGSRLSEIKNPPRFDASGEADIDLVPGEYRFEVAAVQSDDTIVVLRSRGITVPETKSAELVAGEPQSLSLSHEGHDMELTEVAVRCGLRIDVDHGRATGDVRWHGKMLNARPKLILTPGTSAMVNVIGHAGPLHVAAWERVTADARGASIELHTQSHWYNCQFAWRKGTPARRSATAVFVFPDSRVEIPLTEATRVLTNRRFVMLGYGVELDDGKRLEFGPLPYTVHRTERFELGGAELTPRACADYVLEMGADEQGSKRWQHLYWRHDLLDPGGHRLNVAAKGCGVAGTLTRTDGKPAPEGRLDEEAVKALGDPTRALRVKLEWTWNGPQSRVLRPEPFVSLRSEHFQINAVPAWTWRSRNYLSMLERLHAIERQATGRPGPALIKIHWRRHGGGMATMGRPTGGQTRGCWLPFGRYERHDDPFVVALPAPHEMLHTFGYPHGSDMDFLQSLAKVEHARYRWYIVDHPGIVPTIVHGEHTEAVRNFR